MSTATTKYQVTWGKCSNNQWCNLNTVDLAHGAFDGDGCYVIWHGGDTPRTVYVGQGNFRQRFSAHRINQLIQAYAKFRLYVTWSTINKPARDGVEVYLALELKPLVGERHPDVPPLAVNGPWD
jgi:hypothetical protein